MVEVVVVVMMVVVVVVKVFTTVSGMLADLYIARDIPSVACTTYGQHW